MAKTTEKRIVGSIWYFCQEIIQRTSRKKNQLVCLVKRIFFLHNPSAIKPITGIETAAVTL